MNPMNLPFVFSLPHSSHRIPGGLNPPISLSLREVWESVDIGTEELFGALPAVAVITAQWSRLVVDLNRSSEQRGPKGVVPLVDYHGRSVYLNGMAPDAGEVDCRVREYHRPYHIHLERMLLQEGVRGMFDCHSLWGIGPPEAPDPGRARRDITLGNNGDRQGNPLASQGTVTCRPEAVRMMKEIFESNGFTVSLNHPYAGGFITTHYGQRLAAANRFAVQIEVNQGLFLEPGRQEVLPRKLEEAKAGVHKSLAQIAGMVDRWGE